MYRKLITELRYSDTFFQRMLLAIASFTFGISSLIEQCDCWTSMLFIASGVGTVWRILDHRPRIVWGTVLNLFTASLWVTITSANMVIHGQHLSENVGEVMVTLTALFVLTRTDLTPFDKGTA